MLGRFFHRKFSQFANKKLSYMNGISDTPLLSETINQMLRRQAVRYPTSPFQTFCQHKVKYTYQEFDQRVDEVAKGLISLGLQKGDRVGVYAPNRPEWVISQYACARADLILVNVNPAFQTKDLEYALNQVQIKALIMSESFKHSNYVDIVRSIAPEIGKHGTSFECKKAPNLKHIIVCGHKKHKGMINFDDLYKIHSITDTEEMYRREAECDFESATNIQFTSGTTGYPKGATLSHHNILNNAYMVAKILEYHDKSNICVAVPLYHCFGMVVGSLCALTSGGNAVYPSEGFDPKAALASVEREKCESIYGVPSMFIGYLKEMNENQGKYNLETLSKGIIAGSNCPEELMRKCNKILGIKFLSVIYGMTECSPANFQTRRDDSFIKQVTRVGRVHPHVEIKIADTQGNALPIGQKGEVCSRGYNTMIGYWGDPKKTQESIDDKGWMHSGDLAILDEEGYLEVVGRVKDVIIRGGENIFPKEIEDFLMTHPKILDVQIVGVNDENLGEEVVAVIIPQNQDVELTKTEITDFCHGKIAHYKIPRYIQMVKEYPLTATGKVKKNEIRERLNKIMKEENSDEWEIKFNLM